MRLTLFWYMISSPFVEFPRPARVTLCEASEGPGSQGRSSAFTEAPEKSFAELHKQISSGNRNPRGDVLRGPRQVRSWPVGVVSRSRRASCRRAPAMPRSRDREKSGIRNGRRPSDQSRDLIRSHRASPIEPCFADSMLPHPRDSPRTELSAQTHSTRGR